MKKLLPILLLLSLLLPFAVQSQNPLLSMVSDTTLACGNRCIDLAVQLQNVSGTIGYSVDSIPYNPLPFNTGTALPLRADDLWSSVIHLPFSFGFFCDTFDGLIVGTNGTLSFDTANRNLFSTWSIYGPIPAFVPQDLDASILCPWQDLDLIDTGSIYVEIGGSAPYRYFKYAMDSVPYLGGTYSPSSNGNCGPIYASSEVIIHETTNIIDIYIRDKWSCASWDSGFAVEGIIDPRSSIAFTVPGRNATRWTAHNDAWRFSPAGLSGQMLYLYQNNTLIDSSQSDSAGRSVFHICPPYSFDSAISTSYTVHSLLKTCSSTGTITTATRIKVLPLAKHFQLLCAHDTLSLPACSSGRLTPLSTNPDSTVINNAASQISITGFDSAGLYRFSYCDSVRCDTFTVSVNAYFPISQNHTVCDAQPYDFYGRMLSTAGIYYDTIHSITTCDTIVTLYLDFHTGDTITSYDTICEGSYVMFNGQSIRTAGFYSVALSNMYGCDSILRLYLTVDTIIQPYIVGHGDTMTAYPQGAPHYYWYLDNSLIANNDSSTEIYTTPGVYTVVVEYIPNCSWRSDPYLISGVVNTDAGRLKVYPNPNAGSFLIESEGLTGHEYSIVNDLGQQLTHGVIENNELPVHMGEVAEGIYVLLIDGRAIRLTVNR